MFSLTLKTYEFFYNSSWISNGHDRIHKKMLVFKDNNLTLGTIHELIAYSLHIYSPFGMDPHHPIFCMAQSSFRTLMTFRIFAPGQGVIVSRDPCKVTVAGNEASALIPEWEGRRRGIVAYPVADHTVDSVSLNNRNRISSGLEWLRIAVFFAAGKAGCG